MTEQIRYRRTEWKQPLWRVLNTSSSNTNQLAVELKVYETFLRQSFHRFFSANAPRTETEKHTNSSAFRSTAKPRFSNISPTKVLLSPLDRAVNCQLRKQRNRSDLNTCWVSGTLKRPQRDHNQISIVQILCCHYPSRDYHICALSADETSSVKTKCFCMKSSECVWRRMKNLIIVICWTEQNRTKKKSVFSKNKQNSFISMCGGDTHRDSQFTDFFCVLCVLDRQGPDSEWCCVVCSHERRRPSERLHKLVSRIKWWKINIFFPHVSVCESFELTSRKSENKQRTILNHKKEESTVKKPTMKKSSSSAKVVITKISYKIKRKMEIFRKMISLGIILHLLSIIGEFLSALQKYCSYLCNVM